LEWEGLCKKKIPITPLEMGPGPSGLEAQPLTPVLPPPPQSNMDDTKFYGLANGQPSPVRQIVR